MCEPSKKFVLWSKSCCLLPAILPEGASRGRPLKHISTVELKLNGTDYFRFKFNSQKTSFLKETNSIKSQFFDGRTLFSLGIFENSSLWMSSDFFKGRSLLHSTASDLTELGIYFKANNQLNSSVIQVVEDTFDFHLYQIISCIFNSNRIERRDRQLKLLD